MSQEWYLSKDGEKYGPVSSSKLKEMARKGRITRDDLVWHSGLEDWVRAGRLKGLFTKPPPSPPPPLPAVDESEKSSTPVPSPPEATSVSTQPDPPARKRSPKRGEIICPNPNCGYVGKPKKIPRGNSCLGLILFLLFCLPGILYLMLTAGNTIVCPRCGVQVRSGIKM